MPLYLCRKRARAYTDLCYTTLKIKQMPPGSIIGAIIQRVRIPDLFFTDDAIRVDP